MTRITHRTEVRCDHCGREGFDREGSFTKDVTVGINWYWDEYDEDHFSDIADKDYDLCDECLYELLAFFGR